MMTLKEEPATPIAFLVAKPLSLMTKAIIVPLGI